MKTFFLLLILSLPFYGISQKKPFYKRTLVAYEMNKQDTINKKVMITYLDSLKNVISTENNISNAISGAKTNPVKTHSIIEIDSDSLYVSAEIDKNGDIISKIIRIYDENKNNIEKYQVRKGDTIDWQKREYNEFGKYTKLYNKQKESNDFILSMEWTYDEKGNQIVEKKYNDLGKLIEYHKNEIEYKKNEFISTRFSYENGKGFVKKQKNITSGNIQKTYFYENKSGYNYGLKLVFVNGGMQIVERDAADNLKELKVFDRDNNLTILVKNIEVLL
ncbi:hypothetical protein EG240_05710 [Paenimyroides tangerinum]|uniref:Uncharacterized protein n=1 Tax=Paenimyroides tangerinum TaxID=2488728 RepID=A0A3P3W8L8_9FLAO|nr:hypothetical protein [Paenimyroides tangerinum]RRJ91502.1 hypothetical protein EG240_05710 [Paenimyroides tangerinum]